jgi:hypothetical protein
MIRTKLTSFNVTRLRSSSAEDCPMEKFTISDDQVSYLSLDAVYDTERNEVRCSIRFGYERYSPNPRLLISFHTYKDIGSRCQLVLEEEPGGHHVFEGTVRLEGLKGGRSYNVLRYTITTGKVVDEEWVVIKIDINWEDDAHHVTAEMHFERTKQGREKKRIIRKWDDLSTDYISGALAPPGACCKDCEHARIWRQGGEDLYITTAVFCGVHQADFSVTDPACSFWKRRKHE